MDFQRGPAFRNGRADFQHVRAQDFAAVSQIVGVVFHERRSTGQAGAHHLHGANQRGGLPVSFGAKAVSIGHQALHGDAGKLREAVQVFECIGESSEVAVREEMPKSQFDSCCFSQCATLLSVGAERFGDSIGLIIGGGKLIDVGVAHLAKIGRQIAHPISVH